MNTHLPSLFGKNFYLEKFQQSCYKHIEAQYSIIYVLFYILCTIQSQFLQDYIFIPKTKLYSNNLLCCQPLSACSTMYFGTPLSPRPTVLTQYRVTLKCRPAIRRSCNKSRCIFTTLFPFRNPIVYVTLYFGEILKQRYTWSFIAFPSNSPMLFFAHRSRKI